MLFSEPFLEKRMMQQNRNPCKALINRNKLKISETANF